VQGLFSTASDPSVVTDDDVATPEIIAGFGVGAGHRQTVDLARHAVPFR
jgi:hypothetical protein